MCRVLYDLIVNHQMDFGMINRLKCSCGLWSPTYTSGKIVNFINITVCHFLYVLIFCHQMKVRVRDQQYYEKQTEAGVEIVVNRNSQTPRFLGIYSITITENTPKSTSILQVSAQDNDMRVCISCNVIKVILFASLLYHFLGTWDSEIEIQMSCSLQIYYIGFLFVLMIVAMFSTCYYVFLQPTSSLRYEATGFGSAPYFFYLSPTNGSMYLQNDLRSEKNVPSYVVSVFFIQGLIP